MISETGEASLLAHITDRVKGKEIYIPLNNDALENGDLGAINALTNSDVDPYTDTPSYKRTHARMEVVTKRGKSPLNQRISELINSGNHNIVFKFKNGSAQIMYSQER